MADPKEALTKALMSNPFSAAVTNAVQQGDRAGVLGMVPENVRQAWAPWVLPLANPVEFMNTFSPGAAVRDTMDASGQLTNALLSLDPKAALGGATGMMLGAMSAVPGGRMMTKGTRAPVPESWQRAKAQNYNTRQDLYHATTGDFDQFDLARHGTASALPADIPATWLSSRPPTADSYLPRVTRTSEEARAAAGKPREYVEGANVMPVWVRDMDKFHQIDARGTMYDPDYITNALRAAKERGAPGVVFNNLRDPGQHSAASRAAGMEPGKPGTVVAVFADEKIRSKYAQFDPTRQGERSLTAGIVPVMTAGGLVLLVPDDASATPQAEAVPTR